jgi:hypothetical protein
VRLALAWLAMWSFFVAMGLLSVVYARSFGAEATRLMFLSWGLAETLTLVVEEPLLIAIAVLLPAFADGALDNTGVLGAAVSATIERTGSAIGGVFRSVFR